MMTFTQMAACDGDVCDDCGDPAVVAYVGDTLDQETGAEIRILRCADCEEGAQRSRARRQAIASRYDRSGGY
jgi:hypothetical protein